MDFKDEYIQWKGNLPMHLLNTIRDAQWSYRELSKNPNITLDFIEANIEKNWDWNLLSDNPHLTISFIQKHKDRKWNWFALSKNKAIKKKDRDTYPGLPWNINGILINPDTSIEEFEKHIKRNLTFLYHCWVYPNSNMTEAFLEKYQSDIPEWISLAENKNISMEFVKSHLNRRWDWQVLSTNIPVSDIEINAFPWHYYNGVSKNETLTIPFIRKHIRHYWDWKLISSNAGISVEDIENNPDLPWDWQSIALNPNITREFIKKHIDKKSFASILIQNKGLYNDTSFKRSIKKDLDNRKSITNNILFDNISFDIIEHVLSLYIGYD
jgi:hypothetical protein